MKEMIDLQQLYRKYLHDCNADMSKPITKEVVDGFFAYRDDLYPRDKYEPLSNTNDRSTINGVPKYNLLMYNGWYTKQI